MPGTGTPRDKGKDEALTDAGIEVTHAHLIAGGHRYLLSAIASYGPERRPKHFRAPIGAFLAGVACLAVSVLVLGGPSTSLGLAGLGVGFLLVVDGAIWAFIAGRSPALELVTLSGHRARVRLDDALLLPRLLQALDEATGGARH